MGRSIATELMRAGSQKILTAGQDKDGMWHGVELVNHPTPSGCDRWLETYSDKRGWTTPEVAIAVFTVALYGLPFTAA